MPFAPRVSVVLPVFNGHQTLGKALDSIRNQTLQEWELVVVDDGSTDGTAETLAFYQAREPRLRLVRQPHTGIVAALNAGLKAAQARLIARMDADDEAFPDRLEMQADFLDRHPDIGVAGCLVEFGGCAMRAAGYALHVDWVNSLLSPESIEINRFVEAPLAHPSVMFRAELPERHGGYREGPFPEDYELWLRWMEAGVKFGKVNRTLLRWNDPPQRLSRADARYSTEAFYRCKAGYLARWLRAHLAPPRPIWIWGAGRPTRKRAEWLASHGVSIAGYVDIDPRKQGRRLGGGREVVAPEDLPPAGEIFVLGYVGKRAARSLARNLLAARGWLEGRDFLMAA